MVSVNRFGGPTRDLKRSFWPCNISKFTKFYQYCAENISQQIWLVSTGFEGLQKTINGHFGQHGHAIYQNMLSFISIVLEISV